MQRLGLEKAVTTNYLDYIQPLGESSNASCHGIYAIRFFVRTTDSQKAPGKFFLAIEQRVSIVLNGCNHPAFDSMSEDFPIDLLKHLQQSNRRASSFSTDIIINLLISER